MGNPELSGLRWKGVAFSTMRLPLLAVICYASLHLRFEHVDPKSQDLASNRPYLCYLWPPGRGISSRLVDISKMNFCKYGRHHHPT